MHKELLERIVDSNLYVLYKKHDHTVTIEERGGALIAVIDIPFENAHIELETRDGKFIGCTMTTDGWPNSMRVLALTLENIQIKINEFSSVREIIYDDSDFIIASFSELGIDYPDSDKRDLLVNRGGLCSIIQFTNGTPVTKAIPKHEVGNIIRNKLSQGCKMDLTNCEVLEFVDEAAYPNYNSPD